MVEMNKFLKNDLIEILSEPKNVSIKCGIVGGNSIEVEFIDTKRSESYLYGQNTSERNKDIKELITLLKEKV
jgi:hypothetical protein